MMSIYNREIGYQVPSVALTSLFCRCRAAAETSIRYILSQFFPVTKISLRHCGNSVADSSIITTSARLSQCVEYLVCFLVNTQNAIGWIIICVITHLEQLGR